MQKLAQIETAKVPAATAIAGTKVATVAKSNVVMLQTDDTAYHRLGLIVLVGLLGTFIAWSTFAPLGSHATAPGRVVVDVKKQVIQHREGGVVDAIFVEDGDYVKQGQKLMEISQTDAQAEKGTIDEQLLAAVGLEARLNAQLEGHSTLVFPDELQNSATAKARAAEVMADERQQFKVGKAGEISERTVLQQRLQQLQEQARGTEKQIDSQRVLGASYTKELGELQGLFKRQLISNLQLNEVERKNLSVNATIAELESNKARLKVQMGEAQEQLVLQDNTRQKEAATRLSDVRLKIADLRNRLTSASDRLKRTVLTAPKAGTVMNLAYHTQGGVVAPGSSIMEIVPKIDSFDVEAQINSSDIDKVHPGMESEIRFPAFGSTSSFMRAIPGEVLIVSADTITNKDTGASTYLAKVRIKPEGVAELAKHKLELIQGMPAEVSIKTGERTFLDYLLKPAINMVNHAFNEE
jgi:epimerase transport system membrane fusion protein